MFFSPDENISFVDLARKCKISAQFAKKEKEAFLTMKAETEAVFYEKEWESVKIANNGLEGNLRLSNFGQYSFGTNHKMSKSRNWNINEQKL